MNKRKSLVSQEIRDAIVSSYLAGKSMERASREYGYSSQVCRKELKRRNIKPIPRTPFAKTPDEVGDLIVARYQKGHTLEESAGFYGCTKRVCCRLLAERGIEVRPSTAGRKYTCDKHFFDTIDTEAKAYFLGLLLTDGCVHKSIISLQLSTKDRDILEKFVCHLNSDYPVIDRIVSSSQGKQTAYSRLSVRCSSMAKSLEQLGCVPRKTSITKPWSAPKTRPDLQAAFWRGCIDGDGWVTKRGDFFAIGFCGTQDMVQGFIDFASNICGTKTQAFKGKTIWQMEIRGIAMVKILASALYGNANIYLDRKGSVALAAIGTPEKWSQRTDIDIYKLISLYESGHSATELATEFKTSADVIISHLKRAGIKTRSRSEAAIMRRLKQTRPEE